MSSISLKYLATQLNVSVSTVSKALRDYKDVGEDTKTIVKALAKELDFIPNDIAVSLKTKSSKTIGVIFPSIVHWFFSGLFEEIKNEALKNGYLTILLTSNDNVQTENSHLNYLVKRSIDGIILSMSDNRRDFNEINKIRDSGVPVLELDKISKLTKNCSKVSVNDKESVFDATNRLIDSGKNKIAFFSGSLNRQNAVDKFIGYKMAIDQSSVKFDQSLTIPVHGENLNEAYYSFVKLLKKHPDIDGVICHSDIVAIGCLQATLSLNKKIPDDIAIIGYSDWFVSSVIRPSLSTISQPVEELGKTAVKLLIDEIIHKRKNIKYNHQTIVIPTKFIKRSSS